MTLNPTALGLNPNLNVLSPESAMRRPGPIVIGKPIPMATVHYGGSTFSIADYQVGEFMDLVTSAVQEGKQVIAVLSNFGHDRTLLVGPGIPISIELPVAPDPDPLDDADDWSRFKPSKYD